jgi:hypothetical protein
LGGRASPGPHLCGGGRILFFGLSGGKIGPHNRVPFIFYFRIYIYMGWGNSPIFNILGIGAARFLIRARYWIGRRRIRRFGRPRGQIYIRIIFLGIKPPSPIIKPMVAAAAGKKSSAREIMSPTPAAAAPTPYSREGSIFRNLGPRARELPPSRARGPPFPESSPILYMEKYLGKMSPPSRMDAFINIATPKTPN